MALSLSGFVRFVSKIAFDSYDVGMSDEPSTSELLKATRPWWILPIVALLLLALVLVFTDIAPLRQFAYTVF